MEDICERLPPEMLAKIFQHLSLEDLTNIQFVCKQWRNASYQNVLWKNRKFVVNYEMTTAEIKKELQKLPKLQNIESESGCYISPIIINLLVDHVSELKKMNCKCLLDFGHVQTLIQKYPDLESITLDYNSNNLLSIIEYLKSVKSIKEILFTGTSVNITEIMCSRIVKILGDEFPNLEKLDLSCLYSRFIDKEDNLSYTIEKKSKQLTSLKLKFLMDFRVLTELKKCAVLSEFDINIKFMEPHTLQDLEFIFIEIQNSKQFELPEILMSSFISVDNYFKHINLSLCDSKLNREITLIWKIRSHLLNEQDIVKKICCYFSNCKTLSLSWVSKNYAEQNIDNIEKLTNLQILEFSFCDKIANTTIKNISNCKNLKTLEFRHCLNWDSCDYRDFIIRLETFTDLLRELKFLKKLSLLGCGSSSRSQYVKQELIHVCVKKILFGISRVD